MQMDTPLDNVLETGTHVRVLRALAGLPRGVSASGRELARRAGVSHTTAGRVLRGLEDLRVVHLQRAGRSDLYDLNAEHVLVPQIRALFEREGGIRSQLIAYLREELPRGSGARKAHSSLAARGGIRPIRRATSTSASWHRSELQPRSNRPWWPCPTRSATDSDRS